MSGGVHLESNIHLRLYHNNMSLRQLLKWGNNGDRECTRNCSFPNVCYNTSVVYEMKCLTCSQIYIGSTIRRLHHRLQEHLRNHSSSVWRHLQQCLNVPPLPIHEKLQIKILAKDNDAINLRIKEGLFIKQKKPQLNSREELKELNILVWNISNTVNWNFFTWNAFIVIDFLFVNKLI